MKLYRSLLGQFVDQQSDVVSVIRAALAREDFGLAERTMHTLKGVSGNLGAKALSGLAAELERTLKERNAQSMEAGLSGLASDLAQLMEAIRGAVAADPGHPSSNLRSRFGGSRHVAQVPQADAGR